MAVGRLVIGTLGGAFALGSTALLLVDDVRLMRLGVVLALWAAAFATIVVAWTRRDLRVAEEELQVVKARLAVDDKESVSAITA
jgi:hypothetical protein